MTADDWEARLAAAIAVHSRRRKLRAQVRAALAEARRAGKARAHTQRLRTASAARPTEQKGRS